MKGAWFQTSFARLLLGVLALVLVAVGPIAVFSLHFYRSSLEKHYDQTVSVVASGLASAAFKAAAARDVPSMREIVDEVGRNAPVDVAFIVDKDGKIWAHTSKEQFGETFVPEHYLPGHLDAAVPIGASGRPFGYAHAGITRARIEREADAPQMALASLFLFSLVVAAVLAVFFSSSTSKPVRSLTEAARAIAGGKLDANLESMGGPLEIREMARTFEEMRLSLKRHMDKLEKSRRELDRKVHDISILYNVSEAMNAGDYSEGLLDTIISEAVSGTSSNFGAVILYGDEEGKDRVVASRGLDPRNGRDANLKFLEGLAQLLPGSRAPVMRQLAAPRGPGGTEEQELHVLGVPLLVGTDTAGGLLVGRDGEPYEREDISLAEALTSHAARCVERAQLYAASITDGLTGLFVSRFFRMRLKEELKTAARYKRPLSLTMVDIDFFKKVNDNYGHQAGDQVLRVVADCLLTTVREGVDIAARYGGEEFALILPETTKEGARALAERLRVLIEEQRVDIGSETISVTASIGVSTHPEDGARTEVLVEAADNALYRAKREGRNRVIIA